MFKRIVESLVIALLLIATVLINGPVKREALTDEMKATLGTSGSRNR